MSVKLRDKKTKNGASSLYLDFYHNGKRRYEFLNIQLSNKRKFASQDKEKREFAEKIRIKRENELLVRDIETIDNKGIRTNFIDFLILL
jgi:hypothetical protein